MLRIIQLFWTVLSLLVSLLGGQKVVPYYPDDYAAELPQYVIEGDVRVELLRDSLVRLEVKGPRGFENRPSFTVEKRSDWDTVSFTEKENGGYRVIETAQYTVYVPQNAESVDGCYITDPQGNPLWQFETDSTSNVFLPSASEELAAWSFTDTPRVIPSPDGYSVAQNFFENNGWDLRNDAQDVFVFLPAAITRPSRRTSPT